MINIPNESISQSDEKSITVLKDKVYDDFLSELSIFTIKDFNEKCRNRHLEIKHSNGLKETEIKISKRIFLGIMKDVFKKSEEYEKLYEKIFDRFKIMKCEIKSEMNCPADCYYISDITSDEEIDVYEITCALTIFIKCDFVEKMRLLFDITDVDDDGYINESEIKKMIYTVNFLFCDEEAAIKTNSTLLNQSLATLKSQHIYSVIMKYPDELNKIIMSERYVQFTQFYKALEKIKDFKFSVIPCFINFKDCLNNIKSEKEYEIERKYLKEFLSISSEILSSVKSSNEMVKKNTGMFSQKQVNTFKFRKNMSHKNEQKIPEEAFRASKRASNKYNSSIMIKINDKDLKRGQLGIESQERYPLPKGTNYFPNANDIIRVNFNKICELEAHPGKIKVKDIRESTITMRENASCTSRMETSMTNEKGRFLASLQQKTYLSDEDFTRELKIFSNKQRADNHDAKVMKDYELQVKKAADEAKNKLKDTNPSSSLIFGRIEYKKTANK